MEEALDICSEKRLSETAWACGRPQRPWPGHVGPLATPYKRLSRGSLRTFCPAPQKSAQSWNNWTCHSLVYISTTEMILHSKVFTFDTRNCTKRLPQFSNSPWRRTNCLRIGGQPMDIWPFLLSLTKICWRKVSQCALCTVRCHKKWKTWTSASSTWHQSCTKRSTFFFWRRAFIHICAGTFVARNTWERWASQAALNTSMWPSCKNSLVEWKILLAKAYVVAVVIGTFSASLVVWRCLSCHFFNRALSCLMSYWGKLLASCVRGCNAEQAVLKCAEKFRLAAHVEAQGCDDSLTPRPPKKRARGCHRWHLLRWKKTIFFAESSSCREILLKKRNLLTKVYREEHGILTWCDFS